MRRLSRSEYLSSWCLGIGIVLLLLGVKGIRYIPMTPEEARAEAELQLQIDRLNALLRQAPLEFRQQFESAIEEARRRSIRFQREPPYLTLGRWGLGIGILLIGLGAIGLRNRPAEGRWVRSNEDV
jgi:hypothetical protein